eukprot:TRINITY_DN32777_c0_g1_i2.p2 TRINITY_DN32777_c0_g1~~TRINITY_DN32777_c0_g1_i2.p2  ORF type:complete len:121 (-),score=21.04 TRINITY_DN32777_c0_g1_i2:90-452(-)
MVFSVQFASFKTQLIAFAQLWKRMLREFPSCLDRSQIRVLSLTDYDGMPDWLQSRVLPLFANFMPKTHPTFYFVTKMSQACSRLLREILIQPVSYTHLRAHETPEHLVCRLLLEKKKTNK